MTKKRVDEFEKKTEMFICCLCVCVSVFIQCILKEREKKKCEKSIPPIMNNKGRVSVVNCPIVISEQENEKKWAGKEENYNGMCVCVCVCMRNVCDWSRIDTRKREREKFVLHNEKSLP